MTQITFEGATYATEGDETVLQCLRRNDIPVPSSCESGVCQTCLMRAVSGSVPGSAQKGLKDTLQQQGYFLACCCVPDGDMDIGFGDAGLKTPATVTAIEPLNDLVLRVRMEAKQPIEYRPGQFMNFVHDGLVRSYSIASVPEQEDSLEFHVGLVPNGKMSGWLHHDAKLGDSLELQGPHGSCFYTSGNPEQPLFLLGTGTGLAPLYGIARDALSQGHTGAIHLFHGSLERAGLYLVEELQDLSARYDTFHYHPCILNGHAEDGITVGSIDEIALGQIPQLKGWRVFLCGHPDIVKLMQRKTFLAGASLKEIFADAFLASVSD